MRCELVRYQARDFAKCKPIFEWDAPLRSDGSLTATRAFCRAGASGAFHVNFPTCLKFQTLQNR